MGTGRGKIEAERASRVARGETERLGPVEPSCSDTAPSAEAAPHSLVGEASSGEASSGDEAGATPDRDVFSDPSSRRVLRIGSVLAGGRLRVLRRLGQGGMGVVYEAYDHERQARVALKTLSVADPRGIYQFKNEFRALSRIHHPGLVRLHHLYAENDAWFFTMDLIEGERFDRWVRPQGKLDEPRLRGALRKLVQALAAIHDAGKLHRDVKSSNVLVTAEGRVVVLDLGLVAEHFRGGAGQTISDWVLAGTPEYMAPEQAAGQLTSRASDFYAVGVMLFEALTGQLPFQGTLAGILFGKQREPPSFPALDACDGPSDLVALCRALLVREARARPTAAQMLEGACRSLAPEPATPLGSLAPPARTLVGRAAELSALWAAFSDASAGAPVVMLVSGESGIGKTELVGAFLADLRARRGAVVLAGRCYEREGVPFKAIDPLVDELSRYFRVQSREDARALLPRDVAALAQLFPVLARVDVIAEAPARTAADPYELSRRGFAAFAELLGRLRDREPLVLHIDDMHWADVDSARLLRHVLVDRGLAPLLLILSRHSECPASEALETLLGAARSNPACSLRELAVPPLSAEDAERLARELLGESGAALSASIARESRGSPFFVCELSRLAPAAPVCPPLSEAIAARVALLPASARRLLELAALVGQPLGARAALAASQSSQADLDALDDARLLRESEANGLELVECYHDRIREAVKSGLSEEVTRAYHAALVSALTREQQADPELVSRCCEGAGERLAAARYAALAAERASLTMAFDHAAELYQKALDLGLAAADGAEPREDEIELLTRLGRALENAGRGVEAAAAYRRAAALVDGERRLELQRHAAEQLLATGQIDEGAALLREVCRALGVHFPTGPGSALLSLAWTGLRLRSRGSSAKLTSSASPRDGLRLRTAHTLVTGLIGYLPAHVASVAGKYLLLALDTGSVTDRVRSLGFNAYVYSLFDPRSARTNELLWRMQELAEASGRAELFGFASMINGTTAYHLEHYAQARESFARALSALRGSPGMTWEIDAATIYDQLSAMSRGDYTDIARLTPTLVDEALRRGRVWTAAMLSGIAGMPAWLTNGDMASYRRQLAEVARHWTPRARPHWPDFVLLVGDALASIYEGRPEHGFELFETRARVYGRHMLARGGGTGSIAYAIYHARCAAAVLGATPGSGAQRAPRAARALRRSLSVLSRYTTPKASASAHMLRAALVLADGEREACARLLGEAVSGFERAGMHMFVAACRRRHGQLLGGAHGRELIARADRFMLAQGVVDLEAETEMDCPGCRR